MGFVLGLLAMQESCPSGLLSDKPLAADVLRRRLTDDAGVSRISEPDSAPPESRRGISGHAISTSNSISCGQPELRSASSPLDNGNHEDFRGLLQQRRSKIRRTEPFRATIETSVDFLTTYFILSSSKQLFCATTLHKSRSMLTR